MSMVLCRCGLMGLGFEFLDDAGDHVEIAHEGFLLLAGRPLEPAVVLHLHPPGVEAIEERNVIEAATVSGIERHLLDGEEPAGGDALAQAAGGHRSKLRIGFIKGNLQPALLLLPVELGHCLVMFPGELFVAQRSGHASGHVGVGDEGAAVQTGETQGFIVDFGGDAASADGFAFKVREALLATEVVLAIDEPVTDDEGSTGHGGTEAGGHGLPFLKAQFVGDLQASAGEGDF